MSLIFSIDISIREEWCKTITSRSCSPTSDLFLFYINDLDELNGKLDKPIKTTSTAINFGNTTGLRTVNIPIPEALKGKTILSNTWVLKSGYGTNAITTAIPFGNTSAITSRLFINNTKPYDVVMYIRWFYID